MPVDETVATGAALAIITGTPQVSTNMVTPVEIRMPTLGESVEDGAIIRWFKAVGQMVEEETALVGAVIAVTATAES